MRVRVRVRAWLGCQAVGNGGRRLFQDFHFPGAWHGCIAWCPAAGVINHFPPCRESAIVIFGKWKFGFFIVQHGNLVSSYTTNRGPPQTAHRHVFSDLGRG